MQLAFDDFVLDTDRRELLRNSAPIAVEPQVFDLLLYLVENRDHVVTKDDLIATVWKGRIVSDSTVTTRINAARKAVGDSGGQQALIKTYARRGIRFIGDVHGGDPGFGHPKDAATLAAFPCSGLPCVVVLPFNNLSGDPGQEYFSDGITEDIITALSKHRSLIVIARNSSFAFKNPGTDIRRVARTLGVDYLIEGSVRKSDQRVRITAQLVEVESGRHLWAERYDRNLDDLFALQDEITTTIAARIEPEVGTAERLRVERQVVPLLHAWEFFRLGTSHFYKSTAADNLEAQRLFRRAIELDPTLAQAYAYLSYAIVLSMVHFDAEPDCGLLNEAVSIGRKGVEIDDQDGLIRFMHGRALLAKTAYGDALAELQTAVELNPCLAISYCGLADSLTYEGRIPEAIPHFQKAIDLSPYDPMRWAFHAYRALAHIFAREFDLAAECAQKATRVPNAHGWAFAHRVAALGHLQRQEDLQDAKAELLQRKADFTCAYARKRLFYVKDPNQVRLYVDGLRKAGIPA